MLLFSNCFRQTPDKSGYRTSAETGLASISLVRKALPAQPIDATPSNQLIRQYFPWGTDPFSCTRSKPSQCTALWSHDGQELIASSDLMQRLPHLPPAPNVMLLDRRKPKSLSWPHANTTFTQHTYIRWCCIDLSNAPRLPDMCFSAKFNVR